MDRPRRGAAGLLQQRRAWQNEEFVNGTGRIVNGTEVQLTLRKWYGVLVSAPFVTIVAVVSLLCTIYLGPEDAGAGDILALFAWQLASSALTAAAASLVILTGVRAMRDTALPVVVRYLLSGLAAALPVLGIVLILGMLRGQDHWDAASLTAVTLNVVVTVPSISLIIGVFIARRPPEPAPEAMAATLDQTTPGTGGSPAISGNAFLKRLPPDLGRDIIRVSALDHYVEVQTRAGTTLLLMRFADALEELEDIGGLRIHRSHWVARQAIRRVLRQDRALLVEMVDGARLPVSRSQQGGVRAIGLEVERLP
tara:strand:- start:32736 stop:33665 length:930 start_codon:yes stop_codon:yes gene_type:complete